jgi:hypothetical protein
MKIFLILLLIVFYSYEASATDYAIAITAEYSFGVGFPIPVPNTDDKAFPLLSSSSMNLNSEQQCFTQLISSDIEHLALGQAINLGATDVIIKCVKYWSPPNCESIYPGCINSADFGNPRHVNLYREKGFVPASLRLSKDNYQVLQSIAFDKSSDDKLSVLFAVQVKYDKNAFLKLLGKAYNCEVAIQTNEFDSMFRKKYLKESELFGYKIICFNIDRKGGVKHVGEKILRKH